MFLSIFYAILFISIIWNCFVELDWFSSINGTHLRRSKIIIKHGNEHFQCHRESIPRVDFQYKLLKRYKPKFGCWERIGIADRLFLKRNGFIVECHFRYDLKRLTLLCTIFLVGRS